MPVYDNPEYIDWIDPGQFLAQTTLDDGGPARATIPRKMLVRDMGITVNPIDLDGGKVVVQYSSDDAETKLGDLDPDTMIWHSRAEGEFTQKTWENIDAAEGWIRMLVTGFVLEANVDVAVSTRPRVEKVI